MKLEETIGLLKFLSENFNQFNPTDKTAAAWTITLADQDVSAMLDAAARYVRSGKAFPSNPGQLLQLAKRQPERKRGSDAWEEVRNAITLHGYMGDPRFQDEKITRGIRAMGGWYNLATQLSEDVASNRARFIEYYDNLSDREEAIDNRTETEANLRLVDGEALRLLGGLGMNTKQLYGESYSDDADPDSVVEDPN